VQAQTVANAYAAIEVGLQIIPVDQNKINLPSADPVRVAEEIEAGARFQGRGCDPGVGQDGAGDR